MCSRGNNVFILLVQTGFECVNDILPLYQQAETCFFDIWISVWFSVRFRLFVYRNIRIIRVFEGFDLVLVSGNLVWFRFFCPGTDTTYIKVLMQMYESMHVKWVVWHNRKCHYSKITRRIDSAEHLFKQLYSRIT